MSQQQPTVVTTSGGNSCVFIVLFLIIACFVCYFVGYFKGMSELAEDVSRGSFRPTSFGPRPSAPPRTTSFSLFG